MLSRVATGLIPRHNAGCLQLPSAYYLVAHSSGTSLLPKDDKFQSAKFRKLIDERSSAIKLAAQNKVKHAYTIWDRATGTDEVRKAQQKVIQLQDNLRTIQEERRQFLQDLSTIRIEIRSIHSELSGCQKSDPRYLQLVREECDIVRNEKTVHEKFQMADSAERELFVHLTAAINASHEKGKIYENSAKYWSIIVSICATLVGALCTAISFRYRDSHFQRMNSLCQQQSEQVGAMKVALTDVSVALEANKKAQLQLIEEVSMALNENKARQLKQAKLDRKKEGSLEASKEGSGGYMGWFWNINSAVYSICSRILHSLW